jgi:hypothetical protein
MFLSCDRVAVELLVLAAPMIAVPGEAPADYWTNTRYEDEAGERFDDPIALNAHPTQSRRPEAGPRRAARVRASATNDGERAGARIPSTRR